VSAHEDALRTLRLETEILLDCVFGEDSIPLEDGIAFLRSLIARGEALGHRVPKLRCKLVVLVDWSGDHAGALALAEESLALEPRCWDVLSLRDRLVREERARWAIRGRARRMLKAG
jgi:hypothetical protein